MAWIDEITFISIIVLAVTLAITVSMLLFRGMRLKGKEKKKSEEKGKDKDPKNIDLEVATGSLPFRLSKSVQTSTASIAKDELRILDLEREILGDSIRRLYEAQAEGKITESERDKLAITYKNRMSIIKESIAKDETIVALHELEGMQEDLMQLFSERFGELTSKVDELRGRIDIKPIKEVPIKISTPTQMETDDDEDEGEPSIKSSSGNGNSEERVKKKRKPPTEKLDAKSEAEKRIESIRSEVEKVLDKLGQMEIES